MSQFNIDDMMPHLSIDCVIFGYRDQNLKVLISELNYGNHLWALPGGYIFKKESVDQAALRILKERTSLQNIYLDQFRVFGDENRIVQSSYKSDIKTALKNYDQHRFDEATVNWITARFVCIGYYALVDIDKVHPKPGEFEKILEWKNISELPTLTHDHQEIIQYALQALRQNLDQKIIGFNLLPETFTMMEVKELYEAVNDKSYPMNNFQKKILELDVLERLGKKFTGAQNRAPYLYKFKQP